MINPGTLNVRFLKQLKTVLQKIRNKKILICCGGGHLAREYMAAVQSKGEHVEDLIGIECTQCNALLVALYLGTAENVPRNLKELRAMLPKSNLLICGGFPEDEGTTSDGTAAEIAKMIGAKTLINMTNVKGLYTKNPKIFKDAKFIPKISHQEFQRMIDKHHERPGQHFVLDQHAAKVTREKNIQVIILKGTQNLQNALQHKKFTGTIIS